MVLPSELRNSYNPRIAVDMIATGTDVKPLESLLFMRNINSASYFERMKDIDQGMPPKSSETKATCDLIRDDLRTDCPS